MKNYLDDMGPVKTKARGGVTTPRVGAPAPTASPPVRIVENYGRQSDAGPRPTKTLSRGGVAIMGKRKGEKIL